MSIKNKDTIEAMERRGDYSAAMEFRDTLREHGHSEYDRPDRFNPADGAQYSYTGDCAEKAYQDLKSEERREEYRREEEQRMEQEQYYAAQRQSEEEHQ